MLNKYKILFEAKMGCATLGYCEREGRDRDEEHRRYAEFLTREGYTVLSCEGGYVRVAVDAGGIVRAPRPDPEERFPARTFSRRELAEHLSGVTAKPVSPEDRALTKELCRELAEQLGSVIEAGGALGVEDPHWRAVLTRLAGRAGFEPPS